MTEVNNVKLVSKYYITGSEIPIVIKSLPAMAFKSKSKQRA